MCEASAFILREGKEELLMSDVDVVEPESGGLRIVSIYGEQKVIKAKLKSMSLVNHKIVLEET